MIASPAPVLPAPVPPRRLTMTARVSAPPVVAAAPLTATNLAYRYEQTVSAYWRNEPEALRALERQFAAWWEAGPIEPSGEPDAFSPHAAGGRGIRWCDTAAGLTEAGRRRKSKS